MVFVWEDLSHGEMYEIISSGYLPDVDLRGADFRDAPLDGMSFRNRDLSDADFRCADLRNTNFREVKLQNVDFRHADLRGADLSDACLKGAKFLEADLRGANLLCSDLGGAEMTSDDVSTAVDAFLADMWLQSLADAAWDWRVGIAEGHHDDSERIYRDQLKRLPDISDISDIESCMDDAVAYWQSPPSDRSMWSVSDRRDGAKQTFMERVKDALVRQQYVGG